MKKILLVSIIATFLFSCSSNNEEASSNSNDSDKLPALKIEVPSELKGNKDAEEIITTGEEMINKFSNTLEDIIKDNKNIIGKKSDDLSFMEQIQVGKIAVQIAASMAEFAPKFINFQSKIENFKKGDISDEEAKAIDKVGEAFEQRMNEINKKYEDLGK
ncbi:MAG: hypothetical protein DRI94_06245 [Bacteroidetes bacterium]|nr:MAG: hypothetical protein DRI94_06245 [Bacteroidota bacterium]